MEDYHISTMTLKQLYDLAVEMGMKADPRGVEGVRRHFSRMKSQFDELSPKKKRYFDHETLRNPYSDTRLLHGEPTMQIKTVIVGIDAGAAEILLADRLTEKAGSAGRQGKKIDAVISHHPAGHALASLHDVMDLQVDVYSKIGVPENVAYSLMQSRIQEVQRRLSPMNHNQAVDAARLLDVPLLILHTVWDNLGDRFLKDYLSKKKLDTVGEIAEYISEIPEFMEAMRGKNGPQIVSGTPTSRSGKIAIFFTGGTNPSKELYMEQAKAGVGTIIDMHIPEDALKELKKMHVNVINAGHIASDSIGANLYLDQVEKKGVMVVPCSGLIRIKR